MSGGNSGAVVTAGDGSGSLLVKKLRGTAGDRMPLNGVFWNDTDINLIENNLPRRVLIQMNEPLRHSGYTFFQSSFIEGLDIDTTVLAVVKNYGRLFPYISSIIMSIGLLLHLLINLPKLFKKSIIGSVK